MQGGRGKVEAGDTAETVAETVGREQRSTFTGYLHFYVLWPPCIADADIIFSSCGFFFFLLFFLT